MATPFADQVLTAFIGGAVGGLLGAGVRWIEQRLERRRRRRALATAMLADLRVMELDMRDLAKVDLAAEVANKRVTRPGQQFLRVSTSDDLFLFKPETVSRLLYIASLVTHIEEFGALYPSVTPASRPLLHHSVRAKAWFLANEVPSVREELLANGGTLPPREPVPVLEGFDLPELGPPAFSEWTLPPKPPSNSVWVNEAGRPRRE